MTTHLHEDYLCPSCGFTTPVANDFCPNCNSPMDSLGPIDHGKKEDEEDLNDATLTDAEIAAGDDEAIPLSLEALQEKEGEEDRLEAASDSYGSE